MAVTITQDNTGNGDERVVSVALTANTDVSPAIPFGGWADCSVQFAGTFGSVTISIEGSNDGTNWAVLNDPGSNALSGVNTGKIEQILESVRYKRVTAGGTGSAAISVIFFMRRAQPFRL